MAREKTAVIIFPPFNTPTSPPLGAAMLKGFVERELAGWRVKVFDLNLWAFDRVLGAMARGEMRLDGQFGSSADVLNAAACFRGENDKAFYEQPDLYNRYGEAFLQFTETCTQNLTRACEMHMQGGPRPPLIEEFLQAILAQKPDMVGISMIFSHQLPVGALLGKLLRKEHGLPVLLGGSCLADTAAHFLKWYPESADAIIAGEGEEALKQYLADPTDLSKVAGATYFAADGSVRQVEKAASKAIDYYGMPDFSDTDPKRYYSPQPVIPLLLSRGCYWRRCTFCVHYRSAGLTYRVHSMDFTIDMLRKFAAQGWRNFSFIDEMISPPHFDRLAKAIKGAKLDISYYALTKPTREFTSEKLAEMADSGCKYLLWGLESANQRVLDLMDKGTRIEDVSALMRRSHAAGIANHVFMICGFPTETENEFAQTIKFLEDHQDCIYAVHRGVFGLEPESPIFEHAEKFGITRKWMVKDTSTGGSWAYEVESGMSQQQASAVFARVQPFLRAFNPYARYLANYRDHALLVYDRKWQQLQPQQRQFPRVSYVQEPPTPWREEVSA